MKLKVYLFLLGVLLQLLMWFFFFQNDIKNDVNKINQYGVLLVNDYNEHMTPVNNLFTYGIYTENIQTKEPTATRLPGYSFAYGLFRSVFNSDLSLLFLVLFQILLYSYAISILLCWLKESFQSFILLFSVFISLHLLFYQVYWIRLTLPESLSVSFCLLAFMCLVKYIQNFKQTRYVFLFGLLLTWTFFLRGFLVFYLLTGGLILIILLWQKRFSKVHLIKVLFLYSSSFLFFESLWIVRNYNAFGTFIPLQTTFSPIGQLEQEYDIHSYYKPSLLEVRNYISSFGGSNVHFYPNTPMAYFLNKKPTPINLCFPTILLKDKQTRESITLLRNKIQQSFLQQANTKNSLELEAEITKFAQELRQEFKKNHPYYSTIFSPIKRASNLLIFNITTDMPGKSFTKSSIGYKAYKIGILLFYSLTLLFGVLSLFYWVFFMPKNELLPLYLILNSFLLIFCFAYLINIAEYKYFITGILHFFLLIVLCGKHFYFTFVQNNHT